MHRHSRPTNTRPVLLMLAALVGCAQTPETTTIRGQAAIPFAYDAAQNEIPISVLTDQDPVRVAGRAVSPLAPQIHSRDESERVDASAAAATLPGGIFANPASSGADDAASVEAHDTTPLTETLGYTPDGSRTYIWEEPAAVGAGLFSSADYYDWGGFPIYYPYPYAIGPSSYCNPWTGAYSNGSPPCGGYGGGRPATFGVSAGGAGVAAGPGRDRPAVGQSTPGPAKGDQVGHIDRRPDDGWQGRLGNPSSGIGSQATSSSYASSRSSTHSSQASYGRTYNQDRQRGMHRSYRSGRPPTSVRRTSHPR